MKIVRQTVRNETSTLIFSCDQKYNTIIQKFKSNLPIGCGFKFITFFHSFYLHIRKISSRHVFTLAGQFGGSKRSSIILSFNIQENNYTGNIIDDTFFLSPALERGADQVLGSALRILLQVEWINYFRNVNVFKELPYTIARNHDHLVFLSKTVFAHFRVGIAANRVGHRVTKRSGHGETGHIFILQPYPQWPQRIAMLISV